MKTKKFLSLFAIVAILSSANLTYANNTHSIDLEEGSSQYLSVADSSTTSVVNGWTVESWVKPENLEYSMYNTMYALNKRSGENGWGIVLQKTTGDNWVVYVAAGEGVEFTGAAGSTNINDGQWHHVAVYFNGSATKLYIDGELDSTLDIPDIVDTSTPIHTKKATASENYFDGKLDDIRIWNDERSLSEIQNNMFTELSGSESGLQAYWKLNNTLSDATSNGNTFTNNGSAIFSNEDPYITNFTYRSFDNSFSGTLRSFLIWVTELL